MYIDGTLEWSGPIMDRKHTPGQALHAYPNATFVAETFTQHLAKRRANNTVGKANATYTDQADDIIRQALRNCTAVITPTGYPVGVRRADRRVDGSGAGRHRIGGFVVDQRTGRE